MHTLLKRLLLVAFLATSGMVFAGESVDVWDQIYGDARTDSQRHSILLKIMELKDRDFGPTLIKALTDVNNRQIESGSSNEVYEKVTLARLAIQELGNLNVIDSADLVYTVYRTVKSSPLKSDAAVALGKMRALDYAGRLSQDLADLNLPPLDPRTQDKEILAFGLVQALDSMRQKVSFEALFIASEGWYSSASRIKEQAKAAWGRLTDNPSPEFAEIIRKNTLTSIRLAALRAENASKASKEEKSTIARQALRLGMDKASNIPEEIALLAELRMEAMKIMVENGDVTDQGANYLSELAGRYRFDQATFDETLLTYTALGYSKNKVAVNFLIAKLSDFNEAQRKKVNTPRDTILVRELVAALQRLGDVSARDILMRASVIDYDRSVQREMEAAWKSFK